MKKFIIIFILLLIIVNPVYSQKWLKKGDSFSYDRDGVIRRTNDGNLQYLISKGINYRNKSNHWQRHSFTISNDDFGIFTKSYKADYTYRSGTFYTDLYYFEYAGVRTTFKPLQANHVIGVVDYAKVSYFNAYPDADVIRYINGNGIKDIIKLKSSAAPDSFLFIFQHNAREIKSVDSGWELYNKYTGELSFKLAPAKYWDANYVERIAEYTIKKIGTRIFIKIKINSDGMTYPIYIDPTTLITGTTNVKDTYIQQDAPNTNKDGEATIQIIGEHGANDRRRGLFWINTASLTGTCIDVTCSLYVASHSASAALNANNWFIAFDRCMTDWDATTATWDSAKEGAGGVEWDSTAINGGGDRSVSDTILTVLNRYPSASVWCKIKQDSSGYISLMKHITNFTSGAWDNYGWIMKYDSLGEERSFNYAGYIQLGITQSEQANNPRFWITMSTTTTGACSLVLGDTAATYVRLDSILNLYESNMLISIYNGNYNKWYRHDAYGVAYLTSDTAAWYNKAAWKGRKLILESNARNTLMSINRVGSIIFDTSYTFQDVGNLSAGIKLNIDSLWFSMYDTTNHRFKLINPDSLFNYNPAIYTDTYAFNSFLLSYDNGIWRRKFDILDLLLN